MPRGGRPDPSPPGGIPPPRTDHGTRWQTETPPANKFVAAMQRVKHFAEEEVGQRVVAYGARVESQLQARRGGPGTPGGPAAGAGAGAVVASSEKPGRRRPYGKGPKYSSPNPSEPRCVPGDGARLGASRDHTDLFTRLRATAIFIRETEAAARARDDAREEAARDERRRGDASSSSSPSETAFERNGLSDANLTPEPKDSREESGSTLALVASAEALRKTKRQIEGSLLPQYVAFADSLSAAAAKARAARWTAGTPAGAALADAAQADVETHLATLLLVEMELQQALKRLKTAHVRASAINVFQKGGGGLDALRENAVKRGVVNAHALAREGCAREFKAARDRVGAMLAGNEAAKVVSQQRLLRAADAAYADLERYYAAVARVRAECAGHPAFSKKEIGGAPETAEDAARAREGAAVLASLAAAAAAARGALRAAYEDASAVKRDAGSYGHLVAASPDAAPDPFASPLGGTDNSWRAHVAALDAELARENGGDGDGDGESAGTGTGIPAESETAATTPSVLPAWDASLDETDADAARALSDERDAARKRGGLRFQTGLHASARREREAARAAARRRALRDAARRAAASAATEYVRGALRNAVDAVEDATRACAAHASAAAKSAESPAGPGPGAGVSDPGAAAAPGTPATPQTAARGGKNLFFSSPSSERRGVSHAAPAGGASGAYPGAPPDVGSRVVGLGSLGKADRPAKPRRRGAPLAVPAGGWPGSRADATPATPTTPATPATPSSARLGYAFARTTASLVPVKERTAALFLALARVGVPAATADADANDTDPRGVRASFTPALGRAGASASHRARASAAGGAGGGDGRSDENSFRRRKQLQAREGGNAAAGVVGPLARLKLWAKGLRSGARPSERAERSSAYDEIAARHRRR